MQLEQKLSAALARVKAARLELIAANKELLALNRELVEKKHREELAAAGYGADDWAEKCC